MQELEQSFDEVVPGAAAKSGMFLQVVLERAQQEDIGLNFVAKELRKTKQVVLEAPIQLGGKLLSASPMKLIVYADPIGSSLQVGWQLTEQSVHTSMLAFDSIASAQASRSNRNYTPEAQRKLNGILNAFHSVIFVPVLGLLVDAMQQQNQRPSGGFLGA